MSKIFEAGGALTQAIDPVFAAIAEHKALAKEAGRLEAAARAARAKAEKRYGNWIRSPDPHSWPGKAIVSPLYDRWNRADTAARKAAMRMARTKPTTLAGVAAMIDHIQREVAAASDREGQEDWVTTALKTVAVALTRMVAA